MSTQTDSLPGGEDLDLIESVLDRLASIEDWQLTDDQLLARMDRLGVIGDRLQGIRLTTIGAVDDRRLCEELRYSTSDRLTQTDRTTPHRAKHDVHTAKALHRFPHLQAAARAGRVTRDQVNAVLRGLTHLPADASTEDLARVQAELVTAAADHPPRSMQQLANHLVAVVFPDAEDDHLGRQLDRDERRARQNRHVSWDHDGEGSLRIRGKLPHLDGEKLIALITAFTPTARGVDRLIDPENPTAGQRRADALVAMLDTLLADRVAPACGGDRPSVGVLVHYDDLVTGIGAGTLTGSSEQLPARTVRQLACDCDVIPYVLGSNAEVLDVGRASRLVTTPIRRALTVRDRGCVFPGCTVPPTRCDAHHVVPWYAGGNTSQDNLALLCRHHHQILEPDPRAGPGEQWTITIDNHTPWIRPPTRIDPHRTPKRNTYFHP